MMGRFLRRLAWLKTPKLLLSGKKVMLVLKQSISKACVRWIFLEKGGILTFCWVGTHNPCPVMAKA